MNPLTDTSPWTLLGSCPCPRCRPPITEVLKDVLRDADLKISFRRPCDSSPELSEEVRVHNGSRIPERNNP